MNKSLIKNESGYTLIEMFLVLVVFMIIITVTITAVPRYIEKREIENFLIQFSKDISLAQAYAINEQTTVDVYIREEINRYEIVQEMKLILSRSIPENIRFRFGSLSNRLVFGQNGNVKMFGAWRFSTKNYTYVFMVLIGRGRHYYYQES